MKRHHLRLWRTSATSSDGREIWLGVCTHDIGLDVHSGVVSHAIDPILDLERDKVGADLLAGGQVAGEQLVMPLDPRVRGKDGYGRHVENRWSVAGDRIQGIRHHVGANPGAAANAGTGAICGADLHFTVCGIPAMPPASEGAQIIAASRFRQPFLTLQSRDS